MAITHILVQATGTGAGTPSPTATTKLLLHGEDYTDSASSPKTITNLNTTISGSGKFGSAIDFLGTNTSYISTPDHADFDMFSSDFTIDFWVNHDTAPAAITGYMGQSDGGGQTNKWVVLWDNTGLWNTGTPSLVFGSSNTSALDFVGAPWSPTLATWEHIAITRSGSTIRIFGDGILLGSKTIAIEVPTIATEVRIGADGEGGVGVDGKFDEIRFSNTALWTSNFTPPTLPYILT